MTTAPAPLRWQHSAAARVLHAAVGLLAAAGLISSLYLGWTADTELPAGAGYSGGFSAGWQHMLNQPAYFTFLSASLVCITSAALALRPERTSAVFQALRLAGVVQVIITGLVFNLLLRSEVPLSGVWLFNDQVLHVIIPVLVPLVWLAVGPHGRIDGRIVAGSMVLPLVWLAVTMLRGPVLDWYPYVILDVPGMGAAGVAPYIVSILLTFLVIAAAMWGVDRTVCRKASRSSATTPDSS